MPNPFSHQSNQYAQYRPLYPKELFDLLSSLPEHHKTAWDCGTGNGQVAMQLCNYFENVYASDISGEQIAHAASHKKITYSIQPAESTHFPDQIFDLITIAQAIHWFDFDKFYKEVNRTLNPNGVIAVIGYGLLNITPAFDEVFNAFYKFTDPYWDSERKYLDEKYQNIPFPFHEIKVPEFKITTKWTLDHFIGYLNTWSAVKHCIKAECYNPVEEWFPAFKDSWGSAGFQKVSIPLFFRIGRKL
jgi:SAM-dependent methyltransferase